MNQPNYKPPSALSDNRRVSHLLGRPMEHFGNRPIDVCALCDRPIEKSDYSYGGLHLYVGPGMCHGGARENIPIHSVCGHLGQDRFDDQRDEWSYLDSPAYKAHVAYYRNNLLPQQEAS